MSIVSGLHPAGTQISTPASTANQAPLSTAVQPDSTFAPVTELNASAANQNPAQQRPFDQQKLEEKNLTYQLETIEKTRQQNLYIQQQSNGLNDKLLSLAEHSSHALQAENRQTKQTINDLNAEPQKAQFDKENPSSNIGLTPENKDSATENDKQAPSAKVEMSQAQLQLEKKVEAQELAQIRKLSERDIEVKNHEQAHKSVGGQYAGQMSLEFVQGPDGKRYAVGGEVSIDISVVAGDPRATMSKMDQIKRAALAPAEPSSQDRQVAAEASRLQLIAQQDLLKIAEELRSEETELKVEEDEKSTVTTDEKDSNRNIFEDLQKEQIESSSNDFGSINQNQTSSDNGNSLAGLINTFIPSSSIDEQLQNIDLFKAQADKLGRNLDLIV